MWQAPIAPSADRAKQSKSTGSDLASHQRPTFTDCFGLTRVGSRVVRSTIDFTITITAPELSGGRSAALP
jgi:hypothetical protein